jgi:ribosomal protein S12 methylthiotransferase
MPRPKSPRADRRAAPADITSIAFVSLGCPKNLVDSEKMLGLLAEDGIAITPDHDQADAIVINTCGFLEASKTESLGIIRAAIHEKQAAARHGRAKRVIVAGCLVQRHRAELLDAVPEVDALVGVFDRQNIVAAVRGSGTPAAADDKDLGKFHAVTQFISKPTRAAIGQGYRESDGARLRLTPRHYAYLRISEGCNQGCTFCTIPSIRGRMRSKPLADILSEAQELIADGAVELNLIGQDTTSYGSDIGYTAAGEGLPGMLRALDRLVARQLPGGGGVGEGWVRLMYAYPSCFTDEMIKTLADCGHVVKYIDMPLQHISDPILHAMRRKVTRQATETLLGKLRKWVPGISLRTTLISGFPGETDAQHAELLEFVRTYEFDCLGVFEYSPEPGTPAQRLWQTQAVPPEVARQRKEEIMLAQQKIVQRKNAATVGQTLTVLVDELAPATGRRKSASGHTVWARHTGQAPDIDGRVIIKKTEALPGQMLRVTVTGHKGYDLLAERTTGPAQPFRSAKVGGGAEHRVGKSLSLPVLGH